MLNLLILTFEIYLPGIITGLGQLDWCSDSLSIHSRCTADLLGPMLSLGLSGRVFA